MRTAVTASDGTYTILDLRPGVYSVTFALAGFSTVKRDGIELPASFTATVSVTMQVGAVEETITVTGCGAARRHPQRDVPGAVHDRDDRNAAVQLAVASVLRRAHARCAGARPLSQPPGGVDDMGASAHGGAASDYHD